MAETPSDQSSRESRIDDAIARYLEQAERGHPPDQQEYIAKHPDLAAELQSFFADQAQFQQLAGELAPGGATIEPEPENQTPASPTPGSATPGHLPDPSPATMAWKDRSGDLHENVVRYFGDYELLEEIARGGMGVVFKARQTSLNRIVAVKMILSGQLASPEDVQRFRTEAEAAAQLDHPGIVPIYEVGLHEGQHYFSMGFVEGQSLSARVAGGPLPAWEAAELVKSVAAAVQYAHENGVVHRDLKPGNVLLDLHEKPRITDFGLAKLTESHSDLTGTGQILGTPSYMPPEQAAAQVSAVSRLSDVYSLGAILYCLLTGRPPFQAANPMETLLQVQKQEPVAPRQLNPNLPLDLDTIVLKCLDKSPTRRYASAQALAEELNRYLEGRPILARPVGRIERFWRWCRREPVVAGLCAAAAIALIAGTIISSYYGILAANRANEMAKLADEKGKLADRNQMLFDSERVAKEEERLAKVLAIAAAKKEELERTKAQRQLRIATAERLASMSPAKSRDSPELSVLLAVESGRATRHDDEGWLPSSSQALLDALAGIGGWALTAHQGYVTCRTISPDSRWMVAAGSDGTACVWDLTAGMPTANPHILKGHQTSIYCVAISPDSRWLVTGGFQNTALVWDLTAENPAANPCVLSGHRSSIKSVAISRNGHWIVTGSGDKTAQVWDLTAEDPSANPRVMNGHQSGVVIVAISSDSRWIVTGSEDKTARVWDLTAEDPSANPRVLDGHQSGVMSVAISPDNRWIVTGNWESKQLQRQPVQRQPGSDTTVRLWDVTAENSVGKLHVLASNGQQNWIRSLAISPDSRWIVTAGRADDAAHVWDLAAEDPSANPHVLTGHKSLIGSVAISPDSHWVVTGSGDKTSRVWDLTAEDPSANPRVLSGHQSGVTSVAISSDSRWIVTGNADKTARVWDLAAEDPAAEPHVLVGLQSAVSSVVISPDNRWIVADGTIQQLSGKYYSPAHLWDLTDANHSANPRVLAGHNGQVHNVAISPDGRWIVTEGSLDATARIWDLMAANPAANPRVLRGHQANTFCMAISSDSHWVVTGSGDKTARVWDLTAEDPVATHRVLSGHQGFIMSVAISSDSRWVVTGGGDSTARIWDLAAPNPSANPRVLIGHLSGHVGGIRSVAISPDGHWIVTGADDAARVWDLTNEDPSANPYVLKGHKYEIFSVAISPNNRWIVTAGFDDTIRVWDLTDDNPSAWPRLLREQFHNGVKVQISPDNRWLATCGTMDNTALLWDLTAADPAAKPRILRGHQSLVSTLAFSPDSRWIVTGSADKTARIWDLTAENPTANPLVLAGHQSGIRSVAISPDGGWIVTGSADNTARAWRWRWDDLVALGGAVGRNFDNEEWNLYFPGEPYRKTFPDLSAPTDAVVPGETASRSRGTSGNSDRATPQTQAEDGAASRTSPAVAPGDAMRERSTEPTENRGAATDIPRTAGLSEAERFFELADKDKNGEISDEEFNRSLLIRRKFNNAEFTPTFPLKRDVFLKHYPQPGGK